MGLLYGVSGVVLLGCGAIVLAIAALIARIGRLISPAATIVAAPPPAAHVAEPESTAPKIEIKEPPAQATNRAPPELLALAPSGQALSDGRASPQVIGRYAAGASSYVLFSDGAIEAETDAGAMRFASLDDFKSYVATRKR